MAHAERCPVCLGRGLVSDGFYDQCSGHWSSIGYFETCRSCNGKGWIVVSDSTNNEAYDVTDLYGINDE